MNFSTKNIIILLSVLGLIFVGASQLKITKDNIYREGDSVLDSGTPEVNYSDPEVREDCSAHFDAGARVSGYYPIDPDNDSNTVNAYCQMVDWKGGWTRVPLENNQVDSAYDNNHEFDIDPSKGFYIQGRDAYNGDASGWSAYPIIGEEYRAINYSSARGSFGNDAGGCADSESEMTENHWYVRKYNSTVLKLGQGSYRSNCDLLEDVYFQVYVK